MSNIRIIVGLGNPGAEYRNTRHNVGFMVLDRLAAHFGAPWKLDKSRKGEFAAGPGIMLVKPQTYMNDSGSCVGPLMRYFKFEPEQVLCIYDDIAFQTGEIKLRAGGSAGGQNGVKSLIAHMGTEKFPRVRIGIGGPGGKSMTSHVLGGFAPDEQPALEDALTKATAAALTIIKEDFQAAANIFNTKKEKKKKQKPAPAQSDVQGADAEPTPQETP